MSKREKQVVEVQVYGDSILMNICMCMLVTTQEKKKTMEIYSPKQ